MNTSTLSSSFKEPTQFHLFMKYDALVFAVEYETDLLFSVYDAEQNEVIRQVNQLYTNSGCYARLYFNMLSIVRDSIWCADFMMQ